MYIVVNFIDGCIDVVVLIWFVIMVDVIFVSVMCCSGGWMLCLFVNEMSIIIGVGIVVVL